MLENTIGLIEPENISSHPSPDHMFDNNLFEVIVNSFLPGSAGTSFPHPQYLTIDDYENGIMYINIQTITKVDYSITIQINIFLKRFILMLTTC